MDHRKSEQVVRPKAARAKLGVSNATLYRWVKEGRLPKPIRVGPAVSGWPERELDDYLRRRIAERDRAAGE